MVNLSKPRKFIVRASGNTLRTLSTGSIWPRHKKRDWYFGRQGLPSLLFTMKCWPIASKKRYPRMERKLCIKDFLRLGLPALKKILKCLEITVAATAAAARRLGEHIDTCSGAEPRQPHQLQKKECRDLLRTMRYHSKLISEFMEFHKMQYLKIKKNVRQSKDWLTSCEVYTKPNRSFNHWRKQGKSNMFSEASRPACFRNAPKGLLYSSCGVCLMPSPEQKRKIKTRFEIMSVPFYTVREDDTRRAKHGQNPWQYDHWKARGATEGAQQRKYRSILHRWQKEEAYQESQSARG